MHRLIKLLDPLVRRLADVQPNTITLVSLLAGCLAGLSFYLSNHHPAFFFLAGCLTALSGLADVLDGLVARHSGRTSRLGDFLDHFFDRIIEIAILAGLALTAAASTMLGLTAVILVVLNSYIGTQIEASFGKRHSTGLGKLQLFIGLILGSFLLGLFPELKIPILERQVSLVNLFFIIVCALTVQAICHRFRLAMRLAKQDQE
jgi:phosphatidylglycerophosphate synthase